LPQSIHRAWGFGSAVNRAGVRPGDTVAVLGVGGVGINAVQGARVAGARRIIAVDPVEFKREQALRFGATHVYPSLDDAIAAVGALTWGQMCDSVICTFGVMRGDLLEPALTLTAKGGTCVITSVAPIAQARADVNLFMLAMMNKEIKGCLYGSESPRTQIPRLLNLYRDGILKLDELITETYSLDQVNQGYADIAAGCGFFGVRVVPGPGLVLGRLPSLYRFRTRRAAVELRFAGVGGVRQDRGSCLSVCCI
jgi:S-(hydroxymethyl)glutathione dehydrogenase/alcohol dehydrogenase